MLRLSNVVASATRNSSSPRGSKPNSRWLLLAGHAIVIISLAGCEKPLLKANCEELLLRYVDLLAASDRPDSTSLERIRFRQQAREKAAKDPQFAQCSKIVNRRQFDCAMNAQSTDDFERCLM